LVWLWAGAWACVRASPQADKRTGGLTDGLTDGQTDGQTFASWKPGQKTEDSDWAAVVVVIYGSFALRLQHQQQTEKLVKK